MTLTPRPGILDVAPYVGGVSTLSGFDKVIKLSSNEGPFGPSPKAIAAAVEAAKTMHRYPDGSAAVLRNILGEKVGLDAERIVCGAGSDELLQLLTRAYAGPGDEIIHTRYGFLIYDIATRTCGATPVIVEEENFRVSVDNILAAVTPRTKIVFVANPGNPTGTYLPLSELRRLKDGLPTSVLLVIDAAYAEFVEEADYSAGFKLVDESENVVVTRTFSKIGLGGLRLGWVYCPASIAAVLNRVRGPFNVSSIAIAAGVAAIEDKAFRTMCVRHNTQWRDRLTIQLVNMGLTVTPSVANFILVHFPKKPGKDAAAADAFLRSRGIIVRSTASYGLPDCLRITIGLDSEMETLLEAFREFSGSK